MANLMGVTNPVPGYDGPNNTRVQPTAIRPGDTTIQNIPDPTRVGRPDARTDQNGANDALLSDGLRYDSNLQMFLQALRESPDLAAEFTKIQSKMLAGKKLSGEEKKFLQEHYPEHAARAQMIEAEAEQLERSLKNCKKTNYTLHLKQRRA